MKAAGLAAFVVHSLTKGIGRGFSLKHCRLEGPQKGNRFRTDPRVASKGRLVRPVRLLLHNVGDHLVGRVHDHEIVVDHRVIVWLQL
jgi:hypothetical protein